MVVDFAHRDGGFVEAALPTLVSVDYIGAGGYDSVVDVATVHA